MRQNSWGQGWAGWLPWLALGLGLGLACRPVAAEPPLTITIDYRLPQGPFLRLGGVQGSPYPMAPDDEVHTAAFREYRVELCRFPQDCEPNTLTLGGVFPHEDADPDDPAQYRFEALDLHVRAAREAGCAILWQASYDVGSSDRWKGLNLGGRAPRDGERWGRVVTRCLEHFNNGWAAGLQGSVDYVEFLNEPDGLGGFTGPERARLGPAFASFLRTVEAYNRKHPETPVEAVGPGIPLSWDQWPRWRQPMQRLLENLAREGLGLPIFSFHTYGSDTSPRGNQLLAKALRATLDAQGFTSTRLWNSEWQASDHLRGILPKRRPGQSLSEGDQQLYQRLVAAYVLACKIRWQGVVDGACYYLAVRRCVPPTHRLPRLDLGLLFPPRQPPTLLAVQERRLAEWSDQGLERVATTLSPEQGSVSALGLRSARGLGLLLGNPTLASRRLQVQVHLPSPVRSVRLRWTQLGGQSGTLTPTGSADRWEWQAQLPPACSVLGELESEPR